MLPTTGVNIIHKEALFIRQLLNLQSTKRVHKYVRGMLHISSLICKKKTACRGMQGQGAAREAQIIEHSLREPRQVSALCNGVSNQRPSLTYLNYTR